MRLLFVCTGNTCRSPLAEAAWRALDAPASDTTAFSAGLAVTTGARVSPLSVDVAGRWGIDISRHKPRQLALDMVRTADLICTMTYDQAAMLRASFAVEPPRVALLGDFLAERTHDTPPALMLGLESLSKGFEREILDPYGSSLEAYEACGAQIKHAVEALAQALRDGNTGIVAERSQE